MWYKQTGQRVAEGVMEGALLGPRAVEEGFSEQEMLELDLGDLGLEFLKLAVK